MNGASRRKALLVGISEYADDDLPGCDLDALNMAGVLETHEDGRANYSTITVTSLEKEVTRSILRTEITRLFTNVEGHDVLFYFSGHGARTEWGVDLVTYDFTAPDDYGVSLADIANLANASRAREIVIILDCCFSGDIANEQAKFPQEELQLMRLRQDVTVMAASRSEELSWGGADGGDFTKVLLAGLKGAAADLAGNVSAMDLHLVATRAFAGAWEQRPVFKSHYVFPPVLREVSSRLDERLLGELQNLVDEPDATLVLDEAFVGTRPIAPSRRSRKQRNFDDLCELMAQGLVRPDGVPDLSLAIRTGAKVSLTERGKYYWALVN